MSGGDAAPGQKANALRRPKIEFFAHLLHFQKAGDVNLVLDRRGCNPGFWTRDGIVDTSGSKLQGFLNEAIARNPAFKSLRIGLADLSKGIDKPEFVGHQPLKHDSIASTCKISAMLAAFQLKNDLEEFAKTFDAKTEEDLFAAARNMWALSQTDDPSAPATVLHAANPKLEQQGELIKKDGKKIKLKLAEPDLEEIFDVKPNGADGVDVTFTKAFSDDMEQMIPHSNNRAAHRCITRLGFLYIDSVLWQYDLYNPNRAGGLWLGGSYGGTVWGPAPVGASGTKQAGTPAAVAAFFTLAIQRDLVSRQASKDIVDLLDVTSGKHPGGYGSFMVNALGKKGRPVSRALSKVGIFGKIHDCVAISRTHGGTNIAYVAIGMDAADESVFGPLAEELDNCILKNNGVTP